MPKKKPTKKVAREYIANTPKKSYKSMPEKKGGKAPRKGAKRGY